MSTNSPRLPMRAGQSAKLRDLGYDEIWLQTWLAADPARLGLGEIRIVAQELTAPRGGSLDILAADGDTYYSVEVQLGEVDASHSFRVLTIGPATARALRARPMSLSWSWKAPLAGTGRPWKPSPNTCRSW
jgi:hypothetical protein